MDGAQAQAKALQLASSADEHKRESGRSRNTSRAFAIAAERLSQLPEDMTATEAAVLLARESHTKKVNAEFHRGQAANERRRLEVFLENCASRGIKVVIDGVTLSSPIPGGTSGNSNSSTA